MSLVSFVSEWRSALFIFCRNG